MRKRSVGLALCGAFAVALSATADVISVNFLTSPTNHPNQLIAPATTAGLYARANWNNAADNPTNSASGTVTALTNNLGGATTAEITWNSGGTWQDTNASADAGVPVGDAQLAWGYLDDVGNGVDITVSNIPYAAYTAVIYFSTDTDGGSYIPAVINGVSNSTTGTKHRYFSGNNWQASNTIIATNLSNATPLTIDLVQKIGSIRGSVAGIQIVESTEGAPPPYGAEAPRWQVDPITDSATVTESYTGTLAGKAFDPNGDSLTYSNLTGSTWLTINPDGSMLGTPPAPGTNDFVVSVTDGSTAPVTADLQIVVANKDFTIGWNFAEDWPSKMVQGETADGTDQWTDSIDTAAPGTGAVAANSTDPYAITTPVNAAMVTVAWSSSAMWQAGPNTGDPEQQLYRRYLDDGGAGPTITLTGMSAWLTSVGATGYTVDFYRNTDGGTHFSRVDVYAGTGTNGTLLGSAAYEIADGNGSWPTGEGTTAGVRSKQTADGTFSSDVVTFHTDRNLGGTSRGSVSGFKITPTFDTPPGDSVTDLAVAGLVDGGTGLALSWTGENGKPYGVETNANLIIPAGWGTYMTGIMGDGGTITITNTLGPDQALFYRVISE